MTEEISLPPPFIIGAAYNDELGKYEVHSIVGARMTFGRPNGSVGHTDDIPLKARIHRRIVFERQRGRPLIYKQTKRGGGTHEYTYEVVTPFVAQVIEKHSRSSREFIPHVRLQKELLRHPHARSIIDTIAPRPTLTESRII